MQDNHKWDEEFTDHAWSEMRRMLDREMPVRGGFWFVRRRRLVAAAAALLLLVMATGLWRWMPAGGSPPERGGLVAAAKDLPETRISVDAERTGKIAAKGNDGAEQGTRAHSSPVSEKDSRMLAVAGPEGNPQSKQNGAGGPGIGGPRRPGLSTPSVSKPAGGTGIYRKSDRVGKSKLDLSQRPVITGFSFEPNAAPAASGHDVTAPASALPAAAASLPVPQAIGDPVVRPSAENTLTGLAAAPVFVEKAAPALGWADSPRMAVPAEPDRGDGKAFALLPDRWGVQGSTVSGGRSALDGLAFGLTGEFRLGESSPWSVQSGLRYLYQNRNFSFQEPANGSSNRGTESDKFSGNGGVSTAVVFDPTVFPIAARTHSLNLPLMIDYRFAKGKVGIQAGMQMDYAVLTQRSNQVAGTSAPAFSSLGAADMSTVTLVSTQPNASFGNTLLQRWDVGLAGGLHYQVTNQVGLQFRYNFGLVDLVRSDYYAAYNRFFSMGATFYLK